MHSLTNPTLVLQSGSTRVSGEHCAVLAIERADTFRTHVPAVCAQHATRSESGL